MTLRWLLKYIALLILSLTVAALAAYYYWFYVPVVSPPILTGEYSHHTIKVDGIERSYAIYKPASLPDNPKVLFFLHGATRNADIVRQQSAYEFDVQADRHGFIVVYPNGYDNHWNDCRKSARYQANQLAINDTKFIDSLITQLAADYHTRQVAVAGFSNGGHMVYRLAMEIPQKILAAAVIGANLPVVENMDCEASNQPISIAIFNGDNDPVNPYNGGLVKVGDDVSRGNVRSTQQTLHYWLSLAGDVALPMIIRLPEVDGNPSTAVIKSLWLADNNIQIRHYRLQGSGHVIPSKAGRFPRISGGEARDISAAEVMVSFFDFGRDASL